MTTTAIDTNALITFRLQRSGFKTIKKLFEDCHRGKLSIYVPLPVILEIEWVLRSYYKQSKEEIIEFLEELLLLEHVITDRKNEVVLFALNNYKQVSAVNFTDCVILAHVYSSNSDHFLTFDKKLNDMYELL